MSECKVQYAYNMKGTRLIPIFFVLVLSGVLLSGYFYVNSGGSSSHFKWLPVKPGETLPEIVPGEKRTIPFEFLVKGNMSKVVLEIRDADIRDMGVFISGEAVTVKDGKVSSRVYFSLPQGTPPGRYDLRIVAKDVATNEVVGEGTIPFAVYPYFLNIQKCSC